MKIKSIKIKLGASWEDHAGQYKSEIVYEDSNGKVELILDAEISNALMLCIGQTVTQFAAKAARKLEQDCIQSVEEAKGKQIEASTT